MTEFEYAALIEEVANHAASGDLRGELGALRRLGELCDVALAEGVSDYRTRTKTWQDVADALGCSVQAAHQRFRARPRALRGRL